jgi:DNA-directed RNA polymerase specialized sigma24 family protein
MEQRTVNERRVRALDDDALVDAMRAGDEWAFGEFLARFRPVLLLYAEGRIPSELHAECVDDVLEDVALRLADPRTVIPSRLRAYLVSALRKKHLAVKRSRARRRRHHEDAAYDDDGSVAVVRSVCAESTIAASRGALASDSPHPTALEQLAAAMAAELDDETIRLLTWIGRAVPHRTIAEWLGKSYDATTKQIWRLCRRLERAAPQYAATLPPDVQRELERFFRRVERGRRPA